MVKKISVASYGIYLTHQPLGSYGQAWLEGWHISSMSEFVLVSVTVGPVAYFLANLLQSLTRIINTTVSNFFYPQEKSHQ